MGALKLELNLLFGVKIRRLGVKGEVTPDPRWTYRHLKL